MRILPFCILILFNIHKKLIKLEFSSIFKLFISIDNRVLIEYVFERYAHLTI